MKTNDKKEPTLCAWCGSLANETESRVRFNGEYICLTCYEMHKRTRQVSYMFWKGFKQNG